MPIVDADGRLRGIISQADVATRVNRDKTTGEMVEAISERGAGQGRIDADPGPGPFAVPLRRGIYSLAHGSRPSAFHSPRPRASSTSSIGCSTRGW